MNEKQIAILITNLEGGGAQKIAFTQAQALSQENIKIKFIVLEKNGHYNVPDGLEVYFLSQAKLTDSKIQKILKFPKLIIKLAQYLNKENLQLCISHLERADFINILSKYLYSHKTFCVIHSNLSANYQENTFRNKLYSQLIKFTHTKADMLLPVSKGIKFDLINIGFDKNKIKQIPNPFFIQNIQKQAALPLGEYKVIFKKPVIISVARLSKQKSLFHTIKAFARIKESNQKLRYIILGDGELRKNHIKLARKLNLKTYTAWGNQNIKENYDIYFLGFTQNPFNFIANSELYILSSQYEGLPNVIIESLICGTPVISTDVKSGPREILAPNTKVTKVANSIEYAKYGVLIPPIKNSNYLDTKEDLSTDEILLKEAIEQILNNKSLLNQYTELSQNRIQEFNYKRIVDIWLKLISKFI